MIFDIKLVFGGPLEDFKNPARTLALVYQGL
jgi:hypothetical protein